MADNNNSPIDPKSGFNSVAKIFHSLRPSVPIPSPDEQISITHYVQSLHSSLPTTLPPETTPFLIDSVTGERLMYSHFFEQVENLASSLRLQFPSSVLCKGAVAFILVTPSFSVPVLYFALLSLGVVMSPSNTLSSPSEIAHQIEITKPVIAFATSSTAHKIPVMKLGTILLDSPEFQSRINNRCRENVERPVVNQSDSAAILYSSGTTGRVKGVLLTHRNLIALIAGYYHLQPEKVEGDPHPVSLFMLPLFHVFGFFMMVRAVATGDTLVLMEKFDLEKMLKAIEAHKITYIPVSPPLIVALTKSDLVRKYDLSSLKLLGCGGAPLGKEVADKFLEMFPQVEIGQGYGLTETSGGVTRTIGLDEGKRYGSVGRIAENMEAKIVDPSTGEALPPGQRGELWLRGPTIMKGYVGDDAATAATLDSEGWLKTGDLCYFDSDGFLYIVDRLKELIKYKAYQVPPAELEHLLQSNPDIADAAVVPYPDEAAGEIPMAYVVRKPGSSINEAQVMDYIAKLVAPYKKVRRVAFISAIPKSPAGKILRRELVNHAVGISSKL